MHISFAIPLDWLVGRRVLQDLADGYYQYKYFVEFENGTTRYCADPCAKYGGSDQVNENSNWARIYHRRD